MCKLYFAQLKTLMGGKCLLEDNDERNPLMSIKKVKYIHVILSSSCLKHTFILSNCDYMF